MPCTWRAPRNLLEVERKAAPAAADIEHAAVRLDEKLGRNQPLLGQLCLLQRAVRPLEVGAAVLLVGIEEQLVEPMVEIIMMGDVAARAPEVVAADGAAGEEAIASKQARGQRARRRLRVAQHEFKEVVDGAALDDEAAVHEQLADAQLGVENGGAFGARIHEADADLLAGAIAEGVLVPACCHDRQRTALHQPSQDCRQHSFHDTTTGKRASVTPRGRQAQAAGTSQG